MNVFEEINRDRILLKAWFNLYCGSILQYINLPSPVIFMDMGIGNIANMKPVINFFVKPVCLISEPFREEAIKTLYPHAQIWHINKEPPIFMQERELLAELIPNGFEKTEAGGQKIK